MSATLPTPTGVKALIRAHRDAQADQRAAIAADHDRDLAAARVRLAAIETRIRNLGFPALADQLETETNAGVVLIVALTCSDQDAHDGTEHDEAGRARPCPGQVRAAASRRRHHHLPAVGSRMSTGGTGTIVSA
jgi:hypothetical protein